MRVTDLRGRSVAVWGSGIEGRAAALAVAGAGPASLVTVDDTRNHLSLPWTGRLAEVAPLVTGPGCFPALAGAQVVIRSPGIGQTHPWMVELRRRGTVITSGTALWLADHAGCAVGVTGSKGKSTTSSLIHHLLGGIGQQSVLGGNIGTPLLELPDAERYVVELSSYQCTDLEVSPRVAALTALFPEHYDWHGDEHSYYRDKLNLIAHGPQHVVFNGADDRLTDLLGGAEVPGRAEVSGGAGVSGWRLDAPAVAVCRPDSFHVAAGPHGEPHFFLAGQPLFPRSALRLVGRHNEGNLCVALGVLAALGVDCVAARDELAAAVAAFAGLPHRLTPIEDPSGITFVDDTLATNPQSTIHAIDAFAGRPLTVIVGGADRGVDYAPLRDHLAVRGTAVTVVGVPDSGPRIAAALAGLPALRVELADDLVTAVRLARKLTPAGGVVLLSPAAPSFGRFRNYLHRSEVFAQAVADTAASVRPGD